MEKKEALSQKTISGIGWSVGAKASRQGIQLLFQVLLARLLGPEEFGMIAMIVVFTTLADVIKNMGLGQAIIQKKDCDNGHLSTVFWFNVTMGIVMNLLFQLTAPWLAAFYHEPALEKIVRWFSLIYLVSALNIVQEALMQKHLQFKRLFYIETISVTISGIIALFVALNNGGVWSLVVQFLSITVISSLILWFSSHWKPSLTFSMSKFRDLKHFGFNLLGHDLLSFVSRNIDNFLVGKYIGAGALGIYSRAYVLMLQPVNLANQVLARVMFPVFSLLQHDTAAIRRVYLRSTRLLAFVTFPFITIVFVLARPIIEVMLGSQWTEVAAILRIFCVYCLLDTIGVTTGWLYKSLGKTHIMFRWAIYYSVILIAAIITGLQWGVEGVAYAYVTAFLVFLWLPGWHIAFRLISLQLGTMLKNLTPAFLCSILMGAALLWWYESIDSTHYIFLQVMLMVCTGMLLYALVSYLFNRKSFDDISGIIRKKIRFA